MSFKYCKLASSSKAKLYKNGIPPNFTYFWKASLVDTSCWIDFNVSKNSLNENGYIYPGLGDCGDRIFGTK